VSPAALVAACYQYLHWKLDTPVAEAYAPILVAMLVGADKTVKTFGARTWKYSLVLCPPSQINTIGVLYARLDCISEMHIGAWLAQFYGHAKHEGRAPALLDAPVEAFTRAPFFAFIGTIFPLGFQGAVPGGGRAESRNAPVAKPTETGNRNNHATPS
jgi:uncharacterized membrane protein YGL010W